MPDWIHVIFRSILFMIVLFIITKILGKKQISQLSMFEYVTGITIGNIGAELVTDLRGKVHLGVIAIIATAVIPYISSFITMKSKTMRNILDGKGTVLIENGKVLEENLKKEKVTIDEFLEMLRKEGIFDLLEVEYAVLEVNGSLSVLLKKENRPLTPKDIELYVKNEKEAQTVIMDGVILNEPLERAGKSKAWLKKQLQAQHVSVEEVFIGQVNASGQLYLDLYDDSQTVAEDKQVLLASMHKCRNDFEWLSLSAKDDEAKKIYRNNAEKMERVIEKVSNLLER